MKFLKSFYGLLLCLAFIVTFDSCKKEEENEFEKAVFTVSTGDVTELNGNYALASGKLRMTSGKVKTYGHCWSNYQGPTIESDMHSDHGQEGQTTEFITEMTGLEPGTIYYVRSYAKGDQVVYGNEMPFMTPSVQVGNTSIITQTTTNVKLGAHINVYSGVVALYGFCWAQHDKPTIFDAKTENYVLPDNGSFSHLFTQFQPNVKYYVRAYAQSEQLAYGPVIEVVIDNVAFTQTETEQTASTELHITTEIEFKNTSITQHGHCWSTEPEPDINDPHSELGLLAQEGSFESIADGLEKGATYYFRAYAQSEDSIRYSQQYSLALNYPYSLADFTGEGRTGAKSMVIDGELYVGFGSTGSYVNEDVWKYNYDEEIWERMTDFPVYLLPGYTVNKNGYVFYRKENIKVGGYKYNASGDSWEELPGLELGFYPRGLQSYNYNGNVYLALINVSNDQLILWRYSEDTQNWVEESSTTTDRNELQFAFIIDGMAYFAFTEQYYYGFDLLRYDMVNKIWTFVYSYSVGWEDIQFFQHKAKGYLKEGNIYVYQYDPSSGWWNEAPDVQEEGRNYKACIININENIFIGLGSDYEGSTNYDLSFYPYDPEGE